MQRLHKPKYEEIAIERRFTPILDRQIDEITRDIPKNFNKNLRTLPMNNIQTIVDYITALDTEIHLSTNYRKDIIQLLTKFSLHHTGQQFKDITRDDVISFLNSLRKTEAKDPMHKWVGTYNTYLIHIVRFLMQNTISVFENCHTKKWCGC